MVFFFGFLQQFTVGVFLSWECPADPAISINDKNNKRSSVLFWGGEYYFVHRNPSSLFFLSFSEILTVQLMTGFDLDSTGGG